MMFESRSVAGLAIAVLSFAAPALAQDVTFTDVRDAVPRKFFAADQTRAFPGAPNTLVIAFESGIDSRTFSANDFRASTAAFGNRIASDTLSFNVVAPEGYYVSSITYTQRGAGSAVRTGAALGASSWIVGDHPAQLGFFGTNPSLTGKVEFNDPGWTVVRVSISTSLFAFATPALGSASVALTSGEVVVTVALIPPPTFTP